VKLFDDDLVDRGEFAAHQRSDLLHESGATNIDRRIVGARTGAVKNTAIFSGSLRPANCAADFRTDIARASKTGRVAPIRAPG
jgi:hypothetical protein